MSRPASEGHAEPDEITLVVDVANVVGSRPDGWWRDRAGAATRLLARLGDLHGTTVPDPAGTGRVLVHRIVAVVEGAARSATGPAPIEVIAAAHSGDDEIVAQVGQAVDRAVLVVTADRELRARLPGSARTAGPGWLNRLLFGS